MYGYVIKIFHRHTDFYLAYKPSGINFHDEGELGAGFFNQLQSQLGEDIYPVHRLDKLTSGLVIIGRNLSAAQWFQQAFEKHEIEKLYIAISAHKPKKKQGRISGDMKKSRASAWKLLKTKDNPAITQFLSWGDASTTQSLRYFLVKPQTGKTHQIRVALKSLGAPILGDELYGGGASDRGYLHAFAVRFEYQGELVEVKTGAAEGNCFSAMPETIREHFDRGFEHNWPR